MRVDRAIDAVIVGAERARDQFVACERASGVTREGFQQAKLRWRQGDEAAVDAYLTAPAIDLDRSCPQHIRCRTAAATSTAASATSARPSVGTCAVNSSVTSVAACAAADRFTGPPQQRLDARDDFVIIRARMPQRDRWRLPDELIVRG